jgi:hypothetical protein
MNIIIRKAQTRDAEAFLKIKEELKMPLVQETAQGGFLLGTTFEQYRFFIENAFVRVLEDLEKKQIVGFSIILPDEVLRASELWQKKEMIKWNEFDASEFESKKIAYYEQLAILPDAAYRRYSFLLAFSNAKDVIEAGHECMITTIVNYPVRNRAALPFLEAIGCIHIGEVEEKYPDVGRVHSDIYFVDKSRFVEKLQTHPIIKKVITDLNEIMTE